VSSLLAGSRLVAAAFRLVAGFVLRAETDIPTVSAPIATGKTSFPIAKAGNL
tara:strand:- start:12197 stop:12352 length:156 start_codon:yes stop_codon:yes gene_type:complete